MIICSATEALKCIKNGDSIFVQGGAALPDTLVDALTNRSSELKGVKIFTSFALGKGGTPYAKRELMSSFEVSTFFVSDNVFS